MKVPLSRFVCRLQEDRPFDEENIYFFKLFVKLKYQVQMAYEAHFRPLAKVTQSPSIYSETPLLPYVKFKIKVKYYSLPLKD